MSAEVKHHLVSAGPDQGLMCICGWRPDATDTFAYYQWRGHATAVILAGTVTFAPDELAAHDARIKAEALQPIRDALAGHPRCDVHPDRDPISCGWKYAVASVQSVLDRDSEAEATR